MTSLAEQFDVVVGGDTHRDQHTLQIADLTGQAFATVEVDNTQDGFAAALVWILEQAALLTGLLSPRVLVGLEGTRSYGIGLARMLAAAGLVIVEVERPSRTDRRGRGKSDPIDAHLAVQSVLRTAPDRLPVPRADGDREALRILLTARREIISTRTRHSNQLHALLLTGDDTDRQLGRGSFSKTTLQTITRRRGPADASREQQVRRTEASRLARAILTAGEQAHTNLRQLGEIVDALAIGLTDRVGIGPVSAAQALASFSHPGRVRGEAAFAALAGVSPLEASSGRTVRHRLNRGGDRALNRALHDIATSRLRHDPRTRDYAERRRAQGLSDREIKRCLKRYIARELYRALTPKEAAATP